MTYEYEGVKRIVYGEGATFVPVCTACGRFVKPPESIVFDGRDQPVTPTAECTKCGHTSMPFEGYI